MRVIRLLCVVMATMLLTTGCTTPSVPTRPLDHELMNESSLAIPVPDHGEVALLVSLLEETGFFCAQVRANDESAQVWCRDSDDPAENETNRSVSVVNIVATGAGVIQYSDISAEGSGSQSDWDKLREVVTASFLVLWPSDSSKVDTVITEIDRGPGIFPDDPHPPVITNFNTKNASYLIAEGGLVPEFRVITSAIQDRSWPYTADDYATTMTAAGPALERAGFECFPNWTSPCRMSGGQTTNQQITYTTPNPNVSVDNPDQILALDMFIPGTTNDTDLTSLSSVGFPQGLPFLVPTARAPVEKQIVTTRRTGEPFIGIVAGTILIVEPLPNSSTGSNEAQPVNISIGIPPISVIE